MKYRCKKKVDRTGKKYAYYINTNAILYQVSFRAKTSYLHEYKNQRYQSYINLAFVRAVNTTKTCFSEIVSSARSLLKYFQHSKGTFVSPRGHAMPFIYTFRSIFSIRELKQARRRRQQECHKFAYLTEKTIVLHALPVHFPFIGHFADILVLSTT